MRRSKSLWLVLAAFAMFAAACGSDSVVDTVADTASSAADTAGDAAGDVADAAGDAAGDVADAAGDAADAVTGDEGDAMAAMPGEGVSVTMARADWASGYIQAELYRQVLLELGYDVSNPADLELGPQLAYQQMAEGEIDFWTNSWYPGHTTWWEQETTDGGLSGDNLVKVDGLFADSGVQGWLVTKSWVDENNITTLDDINADPELAAQLPDTDGDGVGEVFTCQESWTCDDIQANQFVFAGWDNIQPLKAGYDAMFAQFADLVKAGEPAIIYTWTPASYVTQTIPGVDVYWLSVEADSVLDDSNPLGLEGGENHAQPVPFTGFGADVCTQGPDGCNLGWEAADIQVTANKAFAEANPDLIAMFEQMRPSVVDVSIMQVDQTNGDGSQAAVEDIVAKYMADNRDLVDSWKAIVTG